MRYNTVRIYQLKHRGKLMCNEEGWEVGIVLEWVKNAWRAWEMTVDSQLDAIIEDAYILNDARSGWLKSLAKKYLRVSRMGAVRGKGSSVNTTMAGQFNILRGAPEKASQLGR